MGSKLGMNCKYRETGETYYHETPSCAGVFWNYVKEDNYAITIHNFSIFEETFVPKFPIEENSININFIKEANGNMFGPYEIFSKNTILTSLNSNGFHRDMVLHKNSKFVSVGIQLYEPLIKKLSAAYEHDFLNGLKSINTYSDCIQLNHLFESLYTYKDAGIGANIFYESSVYQILNIIFNSLLQRKDSLINPKDLQSIETIQHYLNDHYNRQIKLDLLCKIAYMSPTKLKKLFKEITHLSITEYIQLKRMQAAENLIINSNLSLKDISLLVGYQSPSRFSLLFKRYKGMSPSKFRKGNH